MESLDITEKPNTPPAQRVDSKRAFKAGTWYVVSSVAVKAVSIITTPIFTRLMDTEEYGVVSTFTTWYSLLLVFCSLNLTYSIGRAKQDFPGELDRYIGAMQVLSAAVTLCISAFALIFIEPVSEFMELDTKEVVLLILYLFFTPSVNFAQNGFRYRYRYKENIGITWYTAVTTVVLSLALIFLIDGDKAILRMAGITAPMVALSLCFWIRSARRGNLNADRKYLRYGLSLSVPLILHTVSLNILAQSDRIFIIKICGASDAGIYSLAYSYGVLLTMITGAVSEGWLPWFHDSFFNRQFDAIRRNVKLVVALGCYVGLACVALAPEAIAVLGGEKYAGGVYCIPPIVLGIVCQYIYTHYVNIELHLKKTIYVSIGTVCAAVLNLVLNAIFIPSFGFVAAAYTTFVSYAALMALHRFITRKILKVKLYDDRFMFGSLIITSLIAGVLVGSYGHNAVRFGLILVGFLSFLWTYRSFILGFVGRWKERVKR